MKRTIQLLCCLFLLAATAVETTANNIPARYTIKGRVVDENGAPLPGASVRLEGTTVGVGTNAKGEFTLSFRNEMKETILLVSFTGYMPRSVIYDIEKDKPLVIRLAPSDNSLEEVIVTGTRSEMPIKNTPVLTRVISRKDIDKLNPVDMQTLLEYELPGIQFGRHHGSGLPTITFQGMSGKHILFLMDGERMAGEGAADETDFTRFNIDEIERVEVTKGALSTVYGSNALGGVVNIITRSADRPFTANVSGRYSNRDEQTYTLSGGTKQNRLSSLSTLSYRKKDAFDVRDKDGETVSFLKGYENWQFTQKLGYRFSDKFSTELKGSYYDSRQIRANKSEKVQSLAENYTVEGKATYMFNSNHRLNMSYHYDNYTKINDYLITGRQSKDYRNEIHAGRLNYVGTLSDNYNLTAGVEVNAERLKHYMFKDTTSHPVENYVAYLQNEWKITDELTTVLSARADYHSEYDLNVTPMVSVMYKPGIFTLRGNYAAGFRSPSLKELYAEWDHQGMFILKGNPDLKPERSNHFSLSAEATKGIFNASVTGYHNRIRDKITNAPRKTDGGTEMVYVNADKSRTSGMDAILQLRFEGGLSLRTSYSFVDDHQKLDGYNISAVRPHSITLNADYTRRIGKVLASLGMNGRWMSSVSTWEKGLNDEYESTRYSSRTICSLQASAKFPRGIRINAGVDNLFNFKDRNVSSDTSISPEQGIGITVGMSVNIADLLKL